MKRDFYLFRWLYVTAIALCLQTSQAQQVAEKHPKQISAHQQPPAYIKGVMLVKFSKGYENLLASKHENIGKFGISRLDSMLQKMNVKAIRQEYAVFFQPGFNEQSAANANRALAAKKLPLVTADMLDQRHKEFGFHLWYRLQFDSTMYLKPVLQQLQSLKGIVELAEPLPLPKMASFNDPFYPQQDALNNNGQNGGTPGADIKAEQAWTITTGDTNVIVAVNDEGVKTDHEDLAKSMWFGKGHNFADPTYFNGTDSLFVPGPGYEHGTWVSGIIAARSNNGIGISGIAGGNGSDTSGVRLMNCVTTDPYYTPGLNASAAFIYAADNGAAISNNSWGDYTSYYYRDDYFADGLRYFSKYGGGTVVKGGVTVWAANNENISTPILMNDYDVDNNIFVAATDNRDTKAYFSNYGDWIDISAPGASVYTTYPAPVNGSLYGPFEGTSASAPVVSGVAALVASVAPGRFTADEVTGIVLSTADNIDSLNPGYEGKLGSGRVNAYRAVLKAKQLAAQPLLDTVSATSVTRTCNGYKVSYRKNAAGNDVMIALGLTRKFDMPNGHVYNVGDSIGKRARVVYKGPASSYTLSQILKDSARHYFKIWSMNGDNYSGGAVLHGDSSFYTLRNPSAIQGANSVAISFGKACPNSDVMVMVNGLPQFGVPQGALNAGDKIIGGGSVLYKGSAAGFTHSGLSSGSYYYALYPVIGAEYGMGKFLGGYCFGVTGVSLPLKTSFEQPGVPQNFALFTPNQNGLGWEITNAGGGSTGAGYAYASNSLNTLPTAWDQPSYVLTAPIDVTASDSVICRFAHAAAAYDSGYLASTGYNVGQYLDTLTVQISTDCGQTWQTAWKKWGYQLQTMAEDPSDELNTTPKLPTDWAQDTVNLTGLILAGTNTIQVAFKNTNRGGINIYLDDINIYKVLHNDAGIAAVVSPTTDVCSATFSPKVALTNFGIDSLLSATVYYRIDSNAVQSFSWSGKKAYLQRDTLTLPEINVAPGNHTLTVYTALPNALTDEVPSNDTTYSSFRVLNPIVLAAKAESSESFEDSTFAPDQWRLANPLERFTWLRISPDNAPGFVAAAGTSAAFVDTWDNAKVGDTLDMYSPVYNTGSADTTRLIFSRAAGDFYNNGATTDTLEVFLTTDCGETFTKVYCKTGADLTTSSGIIFFYPTSLGDWKKDTVDISQLVRNAGNYRFMFRVINTNDNNVLIDDVQVQASGAGVLPVNLIVFTGHRDEVANELVWQTGFASPTVFTIQRSTNGRDFESIGTINALSGAAQTSFHFSDNNLKASKYYYRLAMALAGGQITYSSIIVLASDTNGFQITSFYPSPLKGNTGYLTISSEKPKTLHVLITDMAGRRVKTQTIGVDAGSNNVSIALDNLAAGTYLLHVTDATNAGVTLRFAKE